MANKIGDLLIRIGYSFDSASLKKAQAELKKSGKDLSDIGQSISIGLSAPLAAFGIAAIKAAGDIEGLSLAMKSTFANAGRSAEEAAAEVRALQEAAKAPGLEFEQAVRASIRLQSVGFTAEEARVTIQELANAIASTGGSAENLTSVTQQFAQMSAKGTILQEDLSIIKENLPSISGLMQKAFGTTTAEGLRNLGVTGKQFIEEMTKGMAGLTRVEGGISNSIVNAGSALTQFLAGIGEEINKTFNLSEKSNQFADYLKGLGDTFRNLSDNTKQWIVKIGLFLTALGPAIAIMGAIKLATGQVVGVITSVIAPLKAFSAGYIRVANAAKLAAAEEVLATKAVEAAKASTATANLIFEQATTVKQKATAATKLMKAQEVEAAAASRLLAAQTQVTTAATATSGNVFSVAAAKIAGGFRAMSAASKAFVVIGLAILIYEIAKAVYEWSNQLSDAEQAQQNVNDAMKEAETSISAEKVAVTSLIAVINSETSSKEAKLKAIEDLRKIAPQYYGDLTLEKATIEDLNKRYDAYIDNILKAARAKKAQEALVKLDQEEVDLLNQQAKAEEKMNKLRADGGAINFVKEYIASYDYTGPVDALKRIKIEREKLTAEVKRGYDEEMANAGAAAAAQTKYDAEMAASQSAKASASAANLNRSAASAAAIKIESEQAKVLADNLKRVNDEAAYQQATGIQDIGEQVKIAEDNIRNLINAGFDPLGKEVLAAKEAFRLLQVQMLSMSSFEIEGTKLINDLQNLKNTGVDPTTEAYKEAEAAVRSFFNAANNPITLIPVAAPTAAGGGQVPPTVGRIITAEEIEMMRQMAEETQKAATQTTLLNTAAEGIASLGDSIAAGLSAGKDGFKEFARSATDAIAQVISALIKLAVANAITATLKVGAVLGPIGLALAGAAGIAAGALFKSLVGKAKFAKGTRNAPGGLAMVGETGPELVNLPRHSQVYTANQTKNMLNGNNETGFGGMALSGEFVVRGSDLVLALDRVNQKQNRAR
jgi:tape measure domain-containing protein